MVHATLGGRDESPQLRPGSWDLAFDGELLIELDEELHFNRYRSVTLRRDWTTALPWRNDYLRYCRDREVDCLAAGSWGKRWSNPSCEAMFGPGDPSGVFRQGGAPRWKQRALYDAIKRTNTGPQRRAAHRPGVNQWRRRDAPTRTRRPLRQRR